MRLAHFSPLPPQRSGIADYCASLLPYLSQRMEVTAYSGIAQPQAPLLPLASLQQRAAYDLCLYHMGNHPDYHDTIYQTMLRYPGVVVLHEFNLHAFFLNSPTQDYGREMGYAYGMDGLLEAQRVQRGKRPLITQYPLFNRLVAINLGTIVHTQFAYDTIRSAYPQARLTNIPLAVAPLPVPATPLPPVLAHQSADTLWLASFGYLAPSKRLDVVLHALAHLRADFPNLRYLLVGAPISGYDLTPLIDELQLHDVVVQTGFVEPETLAHYLAACDIGINLRTAPTGGEMSATLLQLLAHGKPTVVANVGGFVALPDNSVGKIDQGQEEQAQLIALLHYWLENPVARQQWGAAGRAYVQAHCSFSAVADQIYCFLEECLDWGAWLKTGLIR